VADVGAFVAHQAGDGLGRRHLSERVNFSGSASETGTFEQVRGEVAMGPLLYNAIYPKQKDGAPIKIFFPPEGAPVNPYATGIPKTAAHPNAAKLFLNWCLSKEGQTFMIKELGNLTSLKVAPVYPEGFDPKVVKVWFPKFDEYVKLHGPWVAEWDKTFGYRQ